MRGAVFDVLADRYDRWYDRDPGRAWFAAEVEALRPFVEPTVHPRLDVGSGSGRFTAALDIDIGIDPAWQPLQLARCRGVRVLRGVAERLPFRGHVFGVVVFVVTLCFVDDLDRVFAETRRVLRPGAPIVIGVIFAEGPLGRAYRAATELGNPFYAEARFLTWPDLRSALSRAGFAVEGVRSILATHRQGDWRPVEVRDGLAKEAAFVALSAR